MSRFKNGLQSDGSYIRSDEGLYPKLQGYSLIFKQQKSWADSNKINYDLSGKMDAYVLNLSENLFVKKLSPETVQEYSEGRGKELENHMRALYSSSALVVNVFEYWRQSHRITEIAKACNGSSRFTAIRFERIYPIFTRGIAPHLDIEFSGENVKSLARIDQGELDQFGTHRKRRDEGPVLVHTK